MNRDNKVRSGRIGVLWADLDSPPIPFARLEAVLTPEEWARSRRSSNLRIRKRWIAGRGLLRYALGYTLGTDPSMVPLAYSLRGKPYLAAGPAFNLSHSGPHLLIAISPGGRVGVDVEVRYRFRYQEALSRSFFTHAEAEAILHSRHDFSDREREETFFRIWVRKEALAKAIGMGVSIPWCKFKVNHGNTAQNLLARLDFVPENSMPWQLQAIASPTGTEAALAWDRPGLLPRQIEWPVASPTKEPDRAA